jgi:hypothetical protein
MADYALFTEDRMPGVEQLLTSVEALLGRLVR